MYRSILTALALFLVYSIITAPYVECKSEEEVRRNYATLSKQQNDTSNSGPNDWMVKINPEYKYNSSKKVRPDLADPELFLNVKQSAGVLPVGAPGGRMFYWMFKDRAVETVYPRPIVFWLCGVVPGCSSTISIFHEHGPYRIKDYELMEPNHHSWHHIADMVYVDWVVGSGFTLAGGQHTKLNQSDSIEHMQALIFDFLVEFIKEYPDVDEQPMYIAGDQFAAQPIVMLIDKILNVKKFTSHLFSNFKGMILVNPFLNAETQLHSIPQFLKDKYVISETAYEYGINKMKECMSGNDVSQCDKVVRNMLGSRDPSNVPKYCQPFPLCIEIFHTKFLLNTSYVHYLLNVVKPWNPVWPVVQAATTKIHFATDVTSTLKKLLQNRDLHFLMINGVEDAYGNVEGIKKTLDHINISYELEMESVDDHIREKRIFTAAGDRKKYAVDLYDSGRSISVDLPEKSRNIIKQFFHDALIEA